MQSTQNRTRAAARWLVQLNEIAGQRFPDLDLSQIEGLREQSGDPAERALQLAEAAIQVLDAVLSKIPLPTKAKRISKNQESIYDESSIA